MRSSRRRQHILAALAIALLAAASAPAKAGLGESTATIEGDRARLGGERTTTIAAAAPSVRVHIIRMADGSLVKEFVGRDDVVFAVSWSTRFKPRLDALLGRFATAYADSARDAARTPGIRHNVALQRNDLVVVASAHLNAHVGIAYARSLVPEGVDVGGLR